MPLNNEESALLRKIIQRQDQLELLMNAGKVQGDVPVSFPGQYPGKPIPDTEGVEIDIETSTVPQQGNIQIAADGPFLVQRIHFAFRNTAGALVGLWRPISSVADYTGAVGINLINFYWEYQTSGSHRNRQNIPVPSACVERAEEGNGAWELYCQDALSPTTTVTFKITPTVAPDYAGVLYVGLHGAYMLE
jgi:hypothetical protein